MNIEKHVESHLKPGESLLLLTDTDIDEEGTFGRRWLAITDRRLLTFGDGAKLNGFEREFSLDEIRDVQTVRLVGKMVVEVDTGAYRGELLSCTNTLSERFAKVAGSLMATCKEGKPFECDLSDEEKRRCEECGRLLPEPDSFCPACLKKGAVLARLLTYMAPHKWKALSVASLVLFTTGLELLPPLINKQIIDQVIEPYLTAMKGPEGEKVAEALRPEYAPAAAELALWVALMFGVHFAVSLLFMMRGRIAAWLGAYVIHDVRQDFYEGVQQLTLKRLDKSQTGSLISRLVGDTTMLNFFFVDALAYVGPVFLQVIGICVILFWLNASMAAMLLIPVPFIIIAARYFFPRLHRKYHLVWQRRAKMTARANDAISGVRVVKSFSQEPKEISQFEARSERFAGSAANAEGLFAVYFPIMNMLTLAGIIVVWYIGGLRTLQGVITLGTLTAFVNYLWMFYHPIQMLTRFADWMNRCFTVAQRVFEVTDAEKEPYDDERGEPLTDVQGAFEFDDVKFGYTKDRPVLKGLSVKVHPGEMIGLVGRSGVGKTTLTNLVCRFYDVDEGAIRLDGKDIRQVKLRDLRRHIGAVPQESFLFDGTIMDNIAYGKPDASKDDIIRVAIAANAHGFIMRQSDGYDTRVGERGARLSGGEKQRIAIARAILHDPKILILDEATSSVDTETEELIQQALANLVKGRTTFAIAHRLSTLRNADRLIVIDEGKVAEMGTHHELMEQKGIYFHLVEMQTQLAKIKAVDG